MSEYHILDYEPRFHAAFRDLNLEWIERYFEVEPSDRQVLDDPQGSILDQGGAVSDSFRSLSKKQATSAATYA